MKVRSFDAQLTVMRCTCFLEEFGVHGGLQNEADLKADFPSMGNTPEMPRVFKTGSRVRNKNVTKRQTEMLVKEIWKARMTHRKAGKAGMDLPQMIFLHLQKTKGLHQAVIEVLHTHTYIQVRTCTHVYCYRQATRHICH